MCERGGRVISFIHIKFFGCSKLLSTISPLLLIPSNGMICSTEFASLTVKSSEAGVSNLFLLPERIGGEIRDEKKKEKYSHVCVLKIYTVLPEERREREREREGNETRKRRYGLEEKDGRRAFVSQLFSFTVTALLFSSRDCKIVIYVNVSLKQRDRKETAKNDEDDDDESEDLCDRLSNLSDPSVFCILSLLLCRLFQLLVWQAETDSPFHLSSSGIQNVFPGKVTDQSHDFLSPYRLRPQKETV